MKVEYIEHSKDEDDYIVTVRITPNSTWWQRFWNTDPLPYTARLIGSGTVWHWYDHDFERAELIIELRMSEIWTKIRYQEKHSK